MRLDGAGLTFERAPLNRIDYSVQRLSVHVAFQGSVHSVGGVRESYGAGLMAEHRDVEVARITATQAIVVALITAIAGLELESVQGWPGASNQKVYPFWAPKRNGVPERMYAGGKVWGGWATWIRIWPATRKSIGEIKTIW
jgi:hypothetical protein